MRNAQISELQKWRLSDVFTFRKNPWKWGSPFFLKFLRVKCRDDPNIWRSLNQRYELYFVEIMITKYSFWRRKNHPNFHKKNEKKDTLFVQISFQFMIYFSKSQDKITVSSNFKMTQKLSSSLEKSTCFDDIFFKFTN